MPMHYCNKYSCFVLQNIIIVSWLRHKTFVEILQYTSRSQFKTRLLRHKIIQSLGKLRCGQTCTKIGAVTHVVYSMQ